MMRLFRRRRSAWDRELIAVGFPVDANGDLIRPLFRPMIPGALPKRDTRDDGEATP